MDTISESEFLIDFKGQEKAEGIRTQIKLFNYSNFLNYWLVKRKILFSTVISFLVQFACFY